MYRFSQDLQQEVSMKIDKAEFLISEENSLIGFETEQVYKLSLKNTNVKICNLHQDKQGRFCVSSVCHADIDTLIEALKFVKRKIK